MQGGEIDLLGVDEFIGGVGAEVFDVFDQEGVRGGMVGEEEDLSAAGSKGASDCGADARCTALRRQLEKSYLKGDSARTVIMITLECIRRSEVLLVPPKYHLRR